MRPAPVGGDIEDATSFDTWISSELSFCFILTVDLGGGNRKAESCFELFLAVVKCKKLSAQDDQGDVEMKFF